MVRARRDRTLLGRLKRACKNAEFEILFVAFAGVFYILCKYFLYRTYEYLEANKVVLPDFKQN